MTACQYLLKVVNGCKQLSSVVTICENYRTCAVSCQQLSTVVNRHQRSARFVNTYHHMSSARFSQRRLRFKIKYSANLRPHFASLTLMSGCVLALIRDCGRCRGSTCSGSECKGSFFRSVSKGYPRSSQGSIKVWFTNRPLVSGFP